MLYKIPRKFSSWPGIQIASLLSITVRESGETALKRKLIMYFIRIPSSLGRPTVRSRGTAPVSEKSGQLGLLRTESK